MRKRTKLLVAILVLTGVLVFPLGGVALAHGPWDTDDEATQDYEKQSGWGHHQGYGVVWYEDLSDLLGLSPEEILNQRQEGKSLVEIAATQGVSEDALVEAILAARADTVQQRIDAGYCTDEMAEEMLERREQNVRQAINRTDSGPPEDGAYCGGYGRAGDGVRLPRTGGHGSRGARDAGCWTGPVRPESAAHAGSAA